MPKKKSKKKTVDPCPVCGNELYLNEEFTQRVGLLDDRDSVIGWLCPHCRTEYDTDDHINKFLGEDSIRGEA
tara:strand:+ start:747 stop:962 length:216 start_codon:yes stop_codon:yes gene_type:complete